MGSGDGGIVTAELAPGQQVKNGHETRIDVERERELRAEQKRKDEAIVLRFVEIYEDCFAEGMTFDEVMVLRKNAHDRVGGNPLRYGYNPKVKESPKEQPIEKPIGPS